MRLTFESKAEQLNYEIGILMGSSLDPQFSQFLGSISFELKSAPEYADEIRKKLINNYDIYSKRMLSQGQTVEPLYFKAIYGNMDAPVVNEVPAAEVSAAPQSQSEQAFQPQPAQSCPTQPEHAYQPGPAQPYFVQPTQAPRQSITPKPEYTVGAIIMSILGSVLLLTGLVYFAVNFLDTFAQGMVLYAICGIVLAVSELVVRRFVPKLSSVFTAIAISGVFLTTVVNYRGLGNIGFGAAAFILAICAILVCFFGYVRKSRLYSVIGFLAAFISSVCIGSDITSGEYLVVTIGTLLISVLWLVFPVKKNAAITGVVMIIAEFLYMLSAMTFNIGEVREDGAGVKIIFMTASWLVVLLIYYFTEKNASYETAPFPGIFGLKAAVMGIAAFFYGVTGLVWFGVLNSDFNTSESILCGVLFYTLIVVPQIILLIKYYRDKNPSAFVFFLTICLTGLQIITTTKCTYIIAPVYVLYALVARIFAKKFDNVAYKVVDLLMQIVIAILLLTCGNYDYANDFEEYFAAILLSACAIAGIFIGRGFATAVQCIYLFSVCYCLADVVIPGDLGEAASMGIVLLLTFLINYFDSVKGKYFRVYNWFALVFDLLLLAFCSNLDVTAEGVFIFCIAAIFGLALVILLLNKEYGMVFAGKFIMIPAYLTFISLIMPLEGKFILSIILMGIALVSVVIGFILKERSVRIYGLVLSILMCGKIAIVDFVSIGDARAKTIMYILVGAFALAIGCIYLVLEVRENKKVSGE